MRRTRPEEPERMTQRDVRAAGTGRLPVGGQWLRWSWIVRRGPNRGFDAGPSSSSRTTR